MVHGLTTAASLWLSAAVGIACGGELFFPASFGVAIMMLLLRFGPRGSEDEKDEDEEGQDAMNDSRTFGSPSYASIPAAVEDNENSSLTNSRRESLKQTRKRHAALASIV